MPRRGTREDPLRSVTLIALAAALVLAPVSVEAAPGRSLPFTMFSWSWLRAPFAWLAQSEPKPEVPCAAPGCFEMASARGFQPLAFEAPDHGRGLYVEIDGSVQFRSAEIVFTDGEVDRLDLQYAIRTDGIFELRDFGRDRVVRDVYMVVRAASPRATMRIRFGRDLE
jgi:hypothetical protein